jgi:hypothetical protein
MTIDKLILVTILLFVALYVIGNVFSMPLYLMIFTWALFLSIFVANGWRQIFRNWPNVF